MNSYFKNKKIAAYIALKHHTRFLTPIMEKLQSLGAQIIYVVGQAERSQEITAIETGLNYAHVFEYLSETDDDAIHRNYRILRDGIVKGIRKDRAVGSTNPLTVLDKTLNATAKEYVGFRNFLMKEKPDVCFALHELNRWGKMISFWAKKLNIPMLTLQEGLYVATDYIYIGHVQYSTLNLVWGKKTQKKLLGYEAPGERIIPVGNTHIAQEIIRLEENNTRRVKRQEYQMEGKYIILLLFSIRPPDINDLMPLFEFMTKNSDHMLICKFHPVTTVKNSDDWKASIPDRIKKEIGFIHGEEDTYALMAMSDLCVLSEPSTTGLEALAIGRPLVQLKLTRPEDFPYDFIQEKVALQLTPGELADRLETKADFASQFDTGAIERYIENELIDTTGATERITAITRKVIQANSDTGTPGVAFREENPGRDIEWSVVIPVPEDPGLFLSILEAVAESSSDSGSYEVLLVFQHEISDQLQGILDAIEGNISIISGLDNPSLTDCFNAAAAQSRGRRLVFLGKSVSPTRQWLAHLAAAYERYPSQTLLGARVVNRHRNIVHAGLVVDINNAPVSAYLHLDENFPSAVKERPFQMLDHFLSMDRSLFSFLGGFHPKADRYGFMDLCLRARARLGEETSVYIPDIRLLHHNSGDRVPDPDASVYFFSRWHGDLWDSELALYRSDNVSQLQIDSARMTRAMELIK